MNKKAQIGDVFSSIIDFSSWFIAFTIVIIIFGVVLFNFGNEMEATGTVGTAETNSMLDFAEKYPSRFDWIPIVIYLAFLAFSVAIARTVPFERGYIALMFILIVVFGAALMFVANTMTYVVNLESFIDIRSQLVVIPLMSKYFLALGLFYMAVCFIALLVDRQ